MNAEAGDFLNAVKDAIEEDPEVEVDFVDKLVIDPSFKNNQKAKCVYARFLSGIAVDFFGSNLECQQETSYVCKAIKQM
jgi:hypothetical protein